MEKRYLINNKVFGSSTEYPNKDKFIPCLYATYEDYLEGWNKNLTELACDESEMNKICNKLDYDRVTEIYLRTIDITSITTVKDGKVYFKEVESESNELKYTTQEMIDAVNYGFTYATESQNHTGDVPIGNILQWIMYKRNLLDIPKEFEIFKTRK